jgi:hypothetical protein
MSSALVQVLEKVRSRRSSRAVAISALGPTTAAAGVVWALLQPYRITLLDPAGQGFWWLAVQPPLLVILVGIVFHLVVLPGVLHDLEEHESEEARGR